MTKRPLLITFEGGEGVGKSTVIDRLHGELGIPTLKTREPGGTKLGEKVRDIVLHGGKVALRSELLLFLASRAQHVEEVIIPALEAGKTVLCDRFHDSSVAYQGIARGLGAEEVEKLSLYATGGLKPDLTLLFDLDPKIGLQRRGKIASFDRIEQEALSFHTKIREAFLSLQKKEPGRIRIIDASQSKEAVYKQALTLIQSFL